MRNTSLLTSSLPAAGFACQTNHGTTGNLGNCRNFSVPLLDNDVFWQNRSFDVGVGSLGTGTLNQQNVVSLYNGGTTTRAVNQPAADATTAAGGGVVITGGTGACVTPVTYWDLERMRWTSSLTGHCRPADRPVAVSSWVKRRWLPARPASSPCSSDH